MEIIRNLKKLVRKYPALVRILQPPVVRVTLALRRHRRRRWYGDHGVLSGEQAGRWIAERIQSGKPSAIGKVGTLELELLVLDEPQTVTSASRETSQDMSDFVDRPVAPQELRRLAFVNIGIFPPTDAVIWGFLDRLRSTLHEMDGLAVWGSPGEDRIMQRHCSGVEVLTVSGVFAPWKHAHPWSSSLAGKRVLVVHPFAQTIGEQYSRFRDAIWRSHPAVLPVFDLVTLRMPLSAGLVAPDESDWHERLDRMQSKMAGLEFDVALIGAGGMSLPLAVHAKRMGKIGIHMGGFTQVLFGIRGRRFDEDESIKQALNDSWVRPGEAETPPNSALIEGGCYW